MRLDIPRHYKYSFTPAKYLMKNMRLEGEHLIIDYETIGMMKEITLDLTDLLNE